MTPLDPHQPERQPKRRPKRRLPEVVCGHEGSCVLSPAPRTPSGAPPPSSEATDYSAENVHAQVPTVSMSQTAIRSDSEKLAPGTMATSHVERRLFNPATPNKCGDHMVSIQQQCSQWHLRSCQHPPACMCFFQSVCHSDASPSPRYANLSKSDPACE